MTPSLVKIPQPVTHLIFLSLVPTSLINSTYSLGVQLEIRPKKRTHPAAQLAPSPYKAHHMCLQQSLNTSPSKLESNTHPKLTPQFL